MMRHLYQKGLSERVLILLHGTGGDENDLIPIAKYTDADAHILSIRGQVSENGMNRFFRRLSPGVLDYKSLEAETKRLYDFIVNASKDYQFSLNKAAVIGYSNGANIASSMLLTYDNPFSKVILLRPMMLQEQEKITSLSGVNILLLSGKNDPIVAGEDPKKLETVFVNRGANVELNYEDSGHQLTQKEITFLRTWYQKFL